MLGEEQTRWLLDQLSDSIRTEASWRVIGQQVVFAPLTDGTDDFNPDGWDGYRANRRRLLDHLERDRIDNVVFLTGDVHSAWALDVPIELGPESHYDPATGVGSRAVELVTPAVSSPALGSSARAMKQLKGIEQRIPHVRYANFEDHGFVILDLTRERARAEFVFTEAVDRRSPVTHPGPVFEVRTHTNHLSSVDSDSSASSVSSESSARSGSFDSLGRSDESDRVGSAAG
jgi:alkaline phosphatase D